MGVLDRLDYCRAGYEPVVIPAIRIQQRLLRRGHVVTSYVVREGNVSRISRSNVPRPRLTRRKLITSSMRSATLWASGEPMETLRPFRNARVTTSLPFTTQSQSQPFVRIARLFSTLCALSRQTRCRTSQRAGEVGRMSSTTAPPRRKMRSSCSSIRGQKGTAVRRRRGARGATSALSR